MRKNGTLTPREQTAALASIDVELNGVRKAIAVLTFTIGTQARISKNVGDAWNALHDAETALRAEHRRVSLNTPASAIERMMANVD